MAARLRDVADAVWQSNASTVATGSATRSAGGSDSSVMRLTKLEFAPFSSRRRTR